MRKKAGIINWRETIYLLCLCTYIVTYTFMREANGLSYNSVVNWQNYQSLLIGIRILLVIIILFDIWDDYRGALVTAITLIVGYMAYQHNPENLLIPLLWFLCAGKNISKTKLIKALFWSHLISLSAVFIMCGVGLLPIEEMIKSGHERVTYSLGFYHPNTVAAKCFQIVLMYWVIKKGKVGRLFYGFLIGVIGGVYWITECWMVMVLLLLLGIFAALYQWGDNKKCRKAIVNKIQKVSIIFYLASVAIFFLISILGSSINFTALLGTIGSRFAETNRYFYYYGVSIWGQTLIDHNSAPELAAKAGLYTLDNGYMHLLIGYGVVVFLLFLFLQIRMLVYFYSKRKFVYVMAFFLFYLVGFLEKHIFNLSMNFTLFFLYEFIWDQNGRKKWFQPCFNFGRKIWCWIDNRKIQIFEVLYLLYMSLILLMAYKDTTMFSFAWSMALRHIVCITAIILIFMKAALDDRWRLREVVIAGVVAVAFVVSWHHYMREYILELAVLIIGARGVPMKKILKVYVTVSIILTVIIVGASLSGQIENLVYIMGDHWNIPRNSFGSIYPTDFAAHLFYISLAYAMLRGQRIKIGEILGLIGLMGISLLLCGARTNAVCIFLVTIIVICFKRNKIGFMTNKIQNLCCLSMPIAAVLMIMGAYFYTPTIEWMRVADCIVNQRFSMGHEGFVRYPITLLGQGVEMQGYGGTTQLVDGAQYFFLDSSYINMLFQYGLIVLITILFLMLYIMKQLKQRNMLEEMALLTVAAVNCTMEHHLIEIAYFPFFLLTLASLEEREKEPLSGTKKLRIAMLGQKCVPSREGGIEIVVEELSTRMVQRGNQVTCYNRSGHHISGKEFDGEIAKEYKGIRLKTVFTINRKGFAAVTSSVFASLRAALGRYDIVHFHAEGPCAMLWLPKLFGKRCVATIHGLDWRRAKWENGLGSKYIRLGERVAVKYADEIIVLSRDMQNYFAMTYGRKTVLIPNGVNRPNIQEPQLIQEKLGLKKDSYILYLGRIVPEKGEHYLIAAFKNVKTDKKLVIAGGISDTDGYMEHLNKEAASDDRIIFTGFVQGQLLEELYSNAYVYVLPSDLEGMPLSLLEAMSYGNCCLVSDIAECTEIVGDKAARFHKSDVRDICEKLQMLCDDENLVQKYKQEVAEFVCKKYNWDEVVDKTLRLYVSI